MTLATVTSGGAAWGASCFAQPPVVSRPDRRRKRLARVNRAYIIIGPPTSAQGNKTPRVFLYQTARFCLFPQPANRPVDRRQAQGLRQHTRCVNIKPQE